MPKREVVASVAFSISGEFIAEHARGLVLCGPGKWRSALEMLVEDLGGMTTDLALSILRGEKTLVGDSCEENGIQLADADPTDPRITSYLHQLNYMFGGMWQYKDHVYRPYARVNTFGHLDFLYASSHEPDWDSNRTSDVPFEVIVRRPMYYARSQTDISTVSIEGVGPFYTIVDVDSDRVNDRKYGAVLWERISDYPLWLSPHKKADDALAAFIESGKRFEQYEADEPTGDSVTSPAVKTKRVPTLDELQAEEEEREAEYQRALLTLRREIHEATAGDWLSIPIHKHDSFEQKEFLYNLQVPRAAFLKWTYDRCQIKPDNVPTWKTLSPLGMKMMNDDPTHSDWVVGAGLDPRTFYQDDNVNSSTYSMRMDILRDTMNFDVEVFSGEGSVYGHLKFLKPGETLENKDQIGVVPNGSMDYDVALQHAAKIGAAIIMAVGGRVCHAAVVARETGLRLVMWPEVMSLLDNSFVSLNLDERTVHVSSS